MRCDVCGLVDPFNGDGDGIGSCDCPRCEGPCGVAADSVLCGCPDDSDEWPPGVCPPLDDTARGEE